MTRATIEPTPSSSAARVCRLLAAASITLALAACGGGDDDAEVDATTTTVVAVAPTTTAAPATTAAPTTVPPVTTVEYVTEGATVVVANASGINGAAGRLTDRLAIAGFSTTGATNSAASVSSLSVTQIHYDASVDAAKAVADSVRLALGGGSIEVVEVEIPAPTESGDLGDAQVLVLMGDDVADKSLDELQGVTTVTEDSVADDTTDGETTDDG